MTYRRSLGRLHSAFWRLAYTSAWAMLILGAVLLITLGSILTMVIGMLHPFFGWTDHPGYIKRYEGCGKPWWLPRPSWHAYYKFNREQSKR